MSNNRFTDSPWYAPAINFPPSQVFPAHDALAQKLTGLYSAELAEEPSNGYLREHSAPEHISSHVAMFRWYWPWVENARTVLDWGCQHAPDAVLLRYAHEIGGTSNDLVIDGCDFAPESEHPNFRAAARMTYRALDSMRSIPYDDDRFDAIIAAGVLEHVASDFDSLRELHRVLRPGGRLAVTFLPNASSLDEHRLRRLGQPHHERLYRRSQTRDLLLHSGFRPLTPVLYQTPAWQYRVENILGPGRAARKTTSALRWVLPVQVFRASTLCVVAEKVTGFA